MVAVTAVLPEPALLATPVDVRIATPGSVDVQVTQGVTSIVVPSLNVAIALNLVEPPCSIATAGGNITIELAFAPVTVNWADPPCPLKTATMVEVPGASPLALPAKMVATEGCDDVQKAKSVRS